MICCIAVFSYRWFAFYVWVFLSVIMGLSMVSDVFSALTIYNFTFIVPVEIYEFVNLVSYSATFGMVMVLDDELVLLYLSKREHWRM